MAYPRAGCFVQRLLSTARGLSSQRGSAGSVVLVALALALAACGQGGAPEPVEAAPATVVEAPQEAAPQPIAQSEQGPNFAISVEVAAGVRAWPEVAQRLAREAGERAQSLRAEAVGDPAGIYGFSETWQVAYAGPAVATLIGERRVTRGGVSAPIEVESLLVDVRSGTARPTREVLIDPAKVDTARDVLAAALRIAILREAAESGDSPDKIARTWTRGEPPAPTREAPVLSGLGVSGPPGGEATALTLTLASAQANLPDPASDSASTGPDLRTVTLDADAVWPVLSDEGRSLLALRTPLGGFSYAQSSDVLMASVSMDAAALSLADADATLIEALSRIIRTRAGAEAARNRTLETFSPWLLERAISASFKGAGLISFLDERYVFRGEEQVGRALYSALYEQGTGRALSLEDLIRPEARGEAWAALSQAVCAGRKAIRDEAAAFLGDGDASFEPGLPGSGPCPPELAPRPVADSFATFVLQPGQAPDTVGGVLFLYEPGGPGAVEGAPEERVLTPAAVLAPFMAEPWQAAFAVGPAPAAARSAEQAP